MRPLAAPVIGGMVSSLIHVLLITPVLFLWIREKELDKPASSLLSTQNQVLDHA
jgi:Cu(I)/Ag(I) efflux system membrane protein CusA/SilA